MAPVTLMVPILFIRQFDIIQLKLEMHVKHTRAMRKWEFVSISYTLAFGLFMLMLW